jgi:preprotein translocase subunit YajC
MNFLVSHAWAAAGGAAPALSAAASADQAGMSQSAVISNLMFVGIVVIMFYFLLVLPQQKRFKKHADMLDKMKKGDRIVTAGGFVGVVDKITPGEEEVIVDLGNGIKLTALRHTIQNRAERPALRTVNRKSKSKDKAAGDKTAA